MLSNQYIALNTQKLAIGYGGNTLLDNLDLQLEKGRLTCLLGPNGIGKTTLIRTMAGLQKALAGEINVDGKPIHQYSKRQLAEKISLVLTERFRSWNTTVFDLVSLGRYPYTGWDGKLSLEDLAKVEEAIQLTHLSFIAHQSIDTLSDGQLQTAMIARALAQDGDIMILDEPTAHLDLSNKIEIMLLLRSLVQKTNKAILVSTHELELAINMADELWICTCGVPMICGMPEELMMSGQLSNIFKGKNFSLDAQTGSFLITHEAQLPVSIEAEERDFRWISQALAKAGFISSQEAPLSVQKKDNQDWILVRNQLSEKFISLQHLIDRLKQLDKP